MKWLLQVVAVDGISIGVELLAILKMWKSNQDLRSVGSKRKAFSMSPR